MSFQNLARASKRLLSFELFPPKTEQGATTLFEHVDRLNQFEPDFVTCTYGAGGSSRDKTLHVVSEIKQRCNTIVASHLTLVGSTVEELRAYLQRTSDANIDAIVALRGDPPAGQTNFQKTPGGLEYANELVALIREEFAQLGVAVAGYPETHREAPSAEIDLLNLRRKVDAGADMVITQLFYDNDDFYRFRDRCRDCGIHVPILAGLLPITQLEQVQRITSLCGSKLPHTLVDKLSEKSDLDWHFQVGVEHATAQVADLMRQQVDGIHFYVLNRSQAVTAIMSTLHNEFHAA
ncbi:MAG TPA: methylenetetrahydrofolate reductase [NAD(P)H] [Pirellulaceae bacterium]|nr:methylenetetrahydrofolate reductase [NAD(P)H] [Pirellulaceae bacterium]HMO92494.1 methylenetetrahydrofolate reductase [NAD(P)H] [Pirellulaceae bacterium]HMP69023.1 methylenetetrahydrofolate reductase [NAD(P)H] [Pirellulaceae bacterium]